MLPGVKSYVSRGGPLRTFASPCCTKRYCVVSFVDRLIGQWRRARRVWLTQPTSHPYTASRQRCTVPFCIQQEGCRRIDRAFFGMGQVCDLHLAVWSTGSGGKSLWKLGNWDTPPPLDMFALTCSERRQQFAWGTISRLFFSFSSPEEGTREWDRHDHLRIK